MGLNRAVFPGAHYRDNTLYSMYAECGRRLSGARDAASDRLISLTLHCVWAATNTASRRGAAEAVAEAANGPRPAAAQR